MKSLGPTAGAFLQYFVSVINATNWRVNQKMPVFQLVNGGQVNADTNYDLVEALRHDAQAWLPSDDSKEFMDKMAAWCKRDSGAVVRTNNYHEFLLMLQSTGYLHAMSDLWTYFDITPIRLSLSISQFAGWHHVLLWSQPAPAVLSTNIKGDKVVRIVDAAEISTKGYLEKWVHEHNQALRRY